MYVNAIIIKKIMGIMIFQAELVARAKSLICGSPLMRMYVHWNVCHARLIFIILMYRILLKLN